MDNAITHNTSKVKDKIKECEPTLSVFQVFWHEDYNH